MVLLLHPKSSASAAAAVILHSREGVSQENSRNSPHFGRQIDNNGRQWKASTGQALPFTRFLGSSPFHSKHFPLNSPLGARDWTGIHSAGPLVSRCRKIPHPGLLGGGSQTEPHDKQLSVLCTYEIPYITYFVYDAHFFRR